MQHWCTRDVLREREKKPAAPAESDGDVEVLSSSTLLFALLGPRQAPFTLDRALNGPQDQRGATGRRRRRRCNALLLAAVVSHSLRFAIYNTRRVTCARGRPVVVCAFVRSFVCAGSLAHLLRARVYTFVRSVRTCVRAFATPASALHTDNAPTRRPVVFTLVPNATAEQRRRNNAMESAARRHNPLKSVPPARRRCRSRLTSQR